MIDKISNCSSYSILSPSGGTDRDYIVFHHRAPGVSKKELTISLCAACHAIVERLQVLRTWLPPQLLILWREQHPDAAMQLQLPLVHVGPGEEAFKPGVVELEIGG